MQDTKDRQAIHALRPLGPTGLRLGKEAMPLVRRWAEDPPGERGVLSFLALHERARACGLSVEQATSLMEDISSALIPVYAHPGRRAVFNLRARVHSTKLE